MANKILFIIGIVVMLGGAYWGLSLATRDNDIMYFPIAYGPPANNQTEMVIAISMFIPHTEGPKLKHGVMMWDEWVSDHFTLRDAAHAVVPLKRKMSTTLMSDAFAGTPEFFLSAALQPGKTYQFEYTPVVAAGKRYRYEFMAPTTPPEPERVRCRPVKQE